jgi:hypothetical protein
MPANVVCPWLGRSSIRRSAIEAAELPAGVASQDAEPDLRVGPVAGEEHFVAMSAPDDVAIRVKREAEIPRTDVHADVLLGLKFPFLHNDSPQAYREAELRVAG